MKNLADRTVYIGYYLQRVEIKDCTVMTDGRNFFVKNDVRTYENVGNITFGSWDEYITDCLLDYSYFKKS